MKFSIALLLLLLLPLGAFAQRDQIFVGTRPLSMGGAFLAVADDGNAIYWNPAGLARMERIQASFAYANLFGIGIKSYYANFLSRFYFIPPLTDYLTFGVDWFALDAGDDELQFNRNQFNFAFGFKPPKTVPFLRDLSFGMTAKILKMDAKLGELTEIDAHGYGWDFGLLYHLDKLPYLPGRFKLGLMVHDGGGTQVKHDTGISETVLHQNLRWGLSYQPFETWPGKLPLSDPVIALDFDERVHVGLEFWLAHTLALRAGLQKDFHTEEKPTLSFGLGLKTSLKNWPEANLDYAFTDSPVLPNTNRQFGGSLTFKEDPRLIRIEKAQINNVFAALYRHYEMPAAKLGSLKLKDEAKTLLHNASSQFEGTVVFILNRSEETDLQTPLGKYPRWAMLASLTSQLMQNRHIEASDIFYPAVLGAFTVWLCTTWFLFIAPRLEKKWQKTRFLFAAGNAFIILFVFVSLRFWQQWLGVFVPLAAFNLSLVLVRRRYYQMTKPELYVDFGLAVLERQGQNYPVQVLTSPAGEEEENVSFPAFFQEELFQEKIRQLKELQAGPEDMKWVGDRLFKALFQREIQNILNNSLNRVANEKKHLRLSLRLDAPELAGLLWELLHSAKLSPSFLLLHQRLSLARYLPLEQPLKELQFRAPLNLLVVVSSPAGLKPLNVAGEIKSIKKALRPLVWGGDIRLRFCENATLDNFRRQLERKPDVMHYIGHSHFDPEKNEAFLDFTNAANKPDPVDAETLGNLLHESTVKLVVLNSCEGAAASDTDAFTGVAQNLVRAGIPAVVAMQYKILDRAAMLFSKAFYSTLITNYSVDAAVAQARRQMMTATRTGPGQHGWATPVLFMRQHERRISNVEP